jgi:hypothetical protein
MQDESMESLRKEMSLATSFLWILEMAVFDTKVKTYRAFQGHKSRNMDEPSIRGG